MRAIVVREAGGSSVLRLAELPAPSPGPDEVTVDVAFAGTGFVDTLFRALLNDFGRGWRAGGYASVAVHQAFADRTAPPKTVLDVSA